MFAAVWVCRRPNCISLQLHYVRPSLLLNYLSHRVLGHINPLAEAAIEANFAPSSWTRVLGLSINTNSLVCSYCSQSLFHDGKNTIQNDVFLIMLLTMGPGSCRCGRDLWGWLRCCVVAEARIYDSCKIHMVILQCQIQRSRPVLRLG